MKVLIGIPYHPNKRYALNHVFDWLEKQTYKNVEPILRVHSGQYGENNAIKTQFEFFRRQAIERADALFIMEADTIPPLDALSRLVAHKKDIVGGLYYYRVDDRPAVAWVKGDDTKSFLQREEDMIKVDGMGTGCVLLSKEVLKTFTFMDWAQNDADYPMYDRLRAQGYDVWLDKSILCKHYETETNFM